MSRTDPNRLRTIGHWTFWLIMLLLTAVVLVTARDDIEQSHVALTLLLVVLGGSAGGGRGLGYLLAVLGFVLIDLFFQAPFGSLSVEKTLDWVVLAAFLASAFVATELLSQARKEAETVRRLAIEAGQAGELREANRAKDEVLAAVSHDLRTPLTTIKLLAQAAASRGEPAAAEIEEQADRLADFVTNVLDLSRIRAGGVTLDLALNTAEDVIAAAVSRAAGLVRERRIVTAVDLDQPALVARFDFVHTLRILGNLIDNALRHSPEDGLVEITTAREGQWLAISVSDRGPGVAPAERDRIFEAFYRPSSVAPDAGHAGLGLSIARRLAELQQGTVEYGPRDGGGSLFTLRLPAVDWNPAAFAPLTSADVPDDKP
jgi:two-component system sensor histidine kinase KdpD